MITNETQKGFNYLRCTKKRGPCSQPYLREERVSQEIHAAIRRLVLPLLWLDWMDEELDRHEEQLHTTLQDELNRLHMEINEIEAKLSRLASAYLADALTIEEYQIGRASCRERV